MAKNDDPYGIRDGLAQAVGKIVKNLNKALDRFGAGEEAMFTVSEQLRAIAPLTAYVVKIMDEKTDEEESTSVGSTVRKYEQLFAPEAKGGGTGGRAGNAGRAKRAAAVSLPGESADPDDAA
jgi:hypothetical protein